MSRRGLFVGVRLGPVVLGGKVGGRGRQRQYRPGVHPLKQDNVRFMLMEMRRRKTGR
jgi:hypothetical protein